MKKNVASQKVRLSLFDGADRVANPTIASGDVKVDLDGAGQGNVSATPTSDAAGLVTWSPTQGETNADVVTVLFNDAAGDEWDAVSIIFYTEDSTSIAAIEVDTGTTLDGKIDTIDSNVDAILLDTGTNGVVLADDAITSAKYDESTAFPVKSTDSGATQIARVGADGDTLETLSDQIDGLPAANWAYTSRTLTQSSASVADAVSGSTVAQYEDTYWAVELTGLTAVGTISEVVCSIKQRISDADDDAMVRVSSGSGLERVIGQAVADVAGIADTDGTIEYDGTAGSATVTLKTVAAKLLPTEVAVYDLKYVDASEEEHAWSAPATWNISPVVTKAT